MKHYLISTKNYRKETAYMLVNELGFGIFQDSRDVESAISAYCISDDLSSSITPHAIKLFGSFEAAFNHSKSDDDTIVAEFDTYDQLRDSYPELFI